MDIDSDSEDFLVCTPPEVREIANNVTLHLLPQKSKEIYERAYARFMDYRQEKGIQSFSENIFLAYMDILSKSMKSSTLWSHYSMLRAVLNVKHNIDISKYIRLRAFLKRKSVGYCPKKSRILTKEEFQKFLCHAPDDKYLMMKVRITLKLVYF